jgi:CRISPR type III-A-associated protein Csm2
MKKKISVNEILGSIEVLETVAEDFGRGLANADAQIRKIFATVLESENLAIVKPRIMYQAARYRGDEEEQWRLRELAKIVSGMIDEIRKEKSKEEFDEGKKKLEQFLEAVVAYAKYYKGRG